jgi:hypothetical protein
MVCPYCGNRIRWWRHYYHEVKQHDIKVYCRFCERVVTLTEADGEREKELKMLPRREQHRIQGLCTICGTRKAQPGRKCCPECTHKKNEQRDKSDVELCCYGLTRKEYDKRRYFGLCLICGEPSEKSGKLCKRCKAAKKGEEE